MDYAHGDFGISYLKIGLTTNEIIASGFPYSLRIGIYASGLIVLFGIAAGILAALRQNRFVDRFLMVLSTLGSTIPSFVFATLYLFLFSKILGLVPAFGVKPWTGYIGPVLVTSVFSMAFVTRLMRTSMIEELNQDYIRTARAKGISEFKVVAKHAMRNAILPVVTYVGPMQTWLLDFFRILLLRLQRCPQFRGNLFFFLYHNLSPSLILDPGINEDIQNINHQCTKHQKHRKEHRNAHDQGVIAGQHARGK